MKWFCICVLFFLIGGCSPVEKTGLEVKVTLSSDFYIGGVLGSTSPSYIAEFSANNTGDKDIQFNKIEITFCGASHESGLVSSIRKAGGESWILKSGEKEEFDTETNGWTREILSDLDKNEELEVRVSFFQDEMKILGPYKAKVPDFGDLPSKYSENEKTSVPMMNWGD